MEKLHQLSLLIRVLMIISLRKKDPSTSAFTFYETPSLIKFEFIALVWWYQLNYFIRWHCVVCKYFLVNKPLRYCFTECRVKWFLRYQYSYINLFFKTNPKYRESDGVIPHGSDCNTYNLVSVNSHLLWTGNRMYDFCVFLFQSSITKI